MEKQEILEKSRRENQKGDERERTIRMEGESFSLLFVFLMGLILHGGGVLQPALRVFDGPDSADLEAGPWAAA